MSYTQSYKGKDNAIEYVENKTRPTPVAMVAPELKHSTDADTEITKACAVLGCENSKNLDNESFFRFPEDANLRQIWTDLTGRNNWTPTDYSYVCIQHFSVDCFECDATNTMVLNESAVPSLKLPKHVLEIEYIDEESLDNEDTYYEEYMDTDEFEEEEETKATLNGVSPTNIPTTVPINVPTNVPNNVPTNVPPNVPTDAQNSVKKQSNGSLQTIKNETKDKPTIKTEEVDNAVLLKLFTEVQKMQRQAVGLKDKLKSSMRVYKRQDKQLQRIEELIERKKKILEQKRKKKSKILLSLQDKISEDMNGLVLAMPIRQTEDFKNFALSIYNYSPQAYVYIRNTLRTMLPSTDALDSWLSSGFQPKGVPTSTNMIKVSAEQTDKELTCKISLG